MTAERIYMDNSATSFPKPAAVTEAMVVFAHECGASAGRGAYAEAKACQQILAECRQRIAQLIGAEGPERIVFAMNCSEALTIAIHGMLDRCEPGTHVVATAMEHNSVLRPLNALKERAGLAPQFVPCDPATGLVDPDDVAAAIRPDTKLVCCVHVSNVTGTIQPIAEVAAAARRAGVPCLIDAAQSAGHVPINVQELGADLVAFPGHKGLLGPLGTGVLYVRPGMEHRLATIKQGGTGTVSELPVQPSSMPDKYEVGSHNAIGLAGLSEGAAWLIRRGVDTIRTHDRKLCKVFLDATTGLPGLSVYGPRDLASRCGVFSVNVAGLSPGELAGVLEDEFGLLTRPGVHCAPLAHQTIGTHPTGTVRLSFGPFTTERHVRAAAEALTDIAQRVAERG